MIIGLIFCGLIFGLLAIPFGIACFVARDRVWRIWLTLQDANTGVTGTVQRTPVWDAMVTVTGAVALTLGIFALIYIIVLFFVTVLRII